MIVETGFLSHVALHPDGRISLIRAEPRGGMYLYIDLSEAEIEALRKVVAARLDQQAST